MAERHDRFRERLPGWVGEWLPAEDAAWCEAHARECAECAALAEWLRGRLPALADEAGHVPVSALEQLRARPDTLTALERELVERHLAGCELCRGDAEAIPAVARVVPMRRVHDWRWWGATAAVAAALVMFVRVKETAQVPPPAPRPGATATAPAAVRMPRIVFSDLQRDAGATASVARDSLRGATDTLELVLPTLFVDGPEPAQLTIRSERDGRVVSQRSVDVAALARPLRFVHEGGAWAAGAHQLVLVPHAGRDTLATRTFRFRLD